MDSRRLSAVDDVRFPCRSYHRSGSTIDAQSVIQSRALLRVRRTLYVASKSRARWSSGGCEKRDSPTSK
jgi:hypothetical protein